MAVTVTIANGTRVWRVSAGDLIAIMQRALVALVPTFDQAQINWRGPNTYDDFERVAEALFDSIVRDSLSSASSLEDAYPATRYGVREPEREISPIYVNDPIERLAFFELETDFKPFDTVVCQRLDQAGKETGELVRVPLAGARFVYEARFPELPPRQVEQLDVVL